VAAPSLAGFKARLDGALSTLGWWKMSLLMAGGLEPDELWGPSQAKPFYDSMIPQSTEPSTAAWKTQTHTLIQRGLRVDRYFNVSTTSEFMSYQPR